MNDACAGRPPDDRWYDPARDMWVRRQGDQVEIGATPEGIAMAGRILAFTCKPRGASVRRGGGLGTVECAKTVIAVHSPVAFEICEGNDALEDAPDGLNRDAYRAWMARGRATDWDADRASLVDASTYRSLRANDQPDAR